MSEQHTSADGDSNAVDGLPAVTPFLAVSKSVFFFNFHATQPDGNSTREKAARHTITLGATRAGKSVSELVRGMYESQRVRDGNENGESR